MKPIVDQLSKIFKRERTPEAKVGLDIGTYSVKIIEIGESVDEKPKVLKFGIEKIKGEATIENQAAATKRLLEQMNVKQDWVNLSVSGPMTIIRFITLPKMTKEDLKKAIRYEAERHIPFKVDEVNLDGYILQDNLENDKMKVLLACAKKKFHKAKNGYTE